MYEGEFLVVTVRSAKDKKDPAKVKWYGDLSNGTATLPVSFDEGIAGKLPVFGEKIHAEFDMWVYNRSVNITVHSWLPVTEAKVKAA